MSNLTISDTHHITPNKSIVVVRDSDSKKLHRIFFTQKKSLFSETSISFEAKEIAGLISILQKESLK